MKSPWSRFISTFLVACFVAEPTKAFFPMDPKGNPFVCARFFDCQAINHRSLFVQPETATNVLPPARSVRQELVKGFAFIPESLIHNSFNYMIRNGDAIAVDFSKPIEKWFPKYPGRSMHAFKRGLLSGFHEGVTHSALSGLT